MNNKSINYNLHGVPFVDIIMGTFVFIAAPIGLYEIGWVLLQELTR